ncbi:MAG: helix-turn-helix transcriptional regulator [Thermovenabulum sp.]|uniref:helix-turn-helix transcriptional regulator n=1 Tax=Thermovenabulum sp. TaxID=3100335 RepID=UPI003C7AD07F
MVSRQENALTGETEVTDEIISEEIINIIEYEENILSEQQKKIYNLINEGYTLREISYILNTSPDVIKKQIERIIKKIKANRSTEEDLKEVIESEILTDREKVAYYLQSNGIKIKNIAKIMGISESAVKTYIRRAKMKNRKKKKEEIKVYNINELPEEERRELIENINSKKDKKDELIENVLKSIYIEGINKKNAMLATILGQKSIQAREIYFRENTSKLKKLLYRKSNGDLIRIGKKEEKMAIDIISKYFEKIDDGCYKPLMKNSNTILIEALQEREEMIRQYDGIIIRESKASPIGKVYKANKEKIRKDGEYNLLKIKEIKRVGDKIQVCMEDKNKRIITREIDSVYIRYRNNYYSTSPLVLEKEDIVMVDDSKVILYECEDAIHVFIKEFYDFDA